MQPAKGALPPPSEAPGMVSREGPLTGLEEDSGVLLASRLGMILLGGGGRYIATTGGRHPGPQALESDAKENKPHSG